MLFRLGRLSLSVVSTLKFKIVAIAVVTGVASAAISTYLVLGRTEIDTQRMLVRHVADERERSAELLASKVELLQSSLSAVASRITPDMLDDHDALTRFVLGQASMHTLFDNVFVAAADGTMRAHIAHGQASSDFPNVGDREYFHHVMRTGLPVVSHPLNGRVTGSPMIIIAAPVKSSGGNTVGTFAGTLLLRNNRLLASVSHDESLDLSRNMVIDVDGTILVHPDPARLLGRAEDEPGLSAAYRQWAQDGRTIHTEGIAHLFDGYLVSMAGVPSADWMVVRVMPESVAIAPLVAARRTAWRVAAGVGAAAALLAGVLAWSFTRRISILRRRAERLLEDSAPEVSDWPHGNDEVGQLSRSFLQVVRERQLRQEETQGLLRQLQAVLDNAEVGIGFTRDGRFELVSQHFCRIFGWDRTMTRNEPTRTIFATDEAYRSLVDRARSALAEHDAFDCELELVRRSGQRFWAHLRGRGTVSGDATQGTIWIIEDVTQARAQRERLAWVASHDSLTGLANRAEFESLLDQATLRSGQHPFCALFIDLDRFKLVNDTAGHAAGDALLRDVSHELVAQVRQTDTVARMGGDEFAVLLPQCPIGQAVVIAEKLRAAVERYELRWEGRALNVGASIGLVMVDGNHANHADVLRAADAACYAAKREGRNRVSVHAEDTPMNTGFATLDEEAS